MVVDCVEFFCTSQRPMQSSIGHGLMESSIVFVAFLLLYTFVHNTAAFLMPCYQHMVSSNGVLASYAPLIAVRSQLPATSSSNRCCFSYIPFSHIVHAAFILPSTSASLQLKRIRSTQHPSQQRRVYCARGEKSL